MITYFIQTRSGEEFQIIKGQWQARSMKSGEVVPFETIEDEISYTYAATTDEAGNVTNTQTWTGSVARFMAARETKPQRGTQ